MAKAKKSNGKNGNGKNGNGHKAEGSRGVGSPSPEVQVRPVVPAEAKEVAYNGYCIARSFHTKLAEAQEAHQTAKAHDKDGTFRWAIYKITGTKEAQAEGTMAEEKDGYAVAVGFDRSTVKAATMLKAALKYSNQFWALRVLATKDHAKGTKQAKLAAQAAK